MLTPEKQQKLNGLLQTINEAAQPHLQEGITYYSTPVRTARGSSNWSVFIWNENQEKDYQNAKVVDEAIDEASNDFTDAVRFYPAHTIVEFKLQKGQDIQATAFTPEMLLNEIKRILQVDSQTLEKEELQKGWCRIDFFVQAYALSKRVLRSVQTNQRLITSDSELFGLSDVTEALYYTLGESLQTLQVIYEGNQFTFQASPAFPELPAEALKDIEIPQETSFEKRSTEASQVIEMRQQFYQTLGKVEQDPIYLNVGGFRDAPWPGDKTAYHTEMLRVIHTESTTILITNGLTNIYSNPKHDPDNKYNGLGAEFYVEFDGIHDFARMRDHFMTAVLNSVAQVALRHGDFVDSVMKKHGTATIQFNVNDVELYCVRGEEVANQGIEDFFLKKHYSKKKKFGVLLNMPSENVPAKMPLTREDVMLIGVKPFGQIWIARDKLLNKDEAVVKSVREKMIKSFQNIRGGRTLVTYHK